MALFAIIATWNNIFASFVNGLGKIKLQMYYGIIAMVINMAASVFFAKNLVMGSAGVVLGTCVSLLLGFILAPIRSWKVVNHKAKGIWLK